MRVRERGTNHFDLICGKSIKILSRLCNLTSAHALSPSGGRGGRDERGERRSGRAREERANRISIRQTHRSNLPEKYRKVRFVVPPVHPKSCIPHTSSNPFLLSTGVQNTFDSATYIPAAAPNRASKIRKMSQKIIRCVQCNDCQKFERRPIRFCFRLPFKVRSTQ